MSSNVTAQETLASVQAKSATYLDVRSAEEFDAGHAPSAKLVPFAFKTPSGMSPNPNFVQEVKTAFPNHDEALIVGCKAGNRSTKAIAALSDAGYTNLNNFIGGWDAWVAAGLPQEK